MSGLVGHDRSEYISQDFDSPHDCTSALGGGLCSGQTAEVPISSRQPVLDRLEITGLFTQGDSCVLGKEGAKDFDKEFRLLVDHQFCREEAGGGFAFLPSFAFVGRLALVAKIEADVADGLGIGLVAAAHADTGDEGPGLGLEKESDKDLIPRMTRLIGIVLGIVGAGDTGERPIRNLRGDGRCREGIFWPCET